MSLSKRCPKCGETKDIDAFGVVGKERRVQGWCKPCRSLSTQERYRSLPPKEAWARWTVSRLKMRAAAAGIAFSLSWQVLQDMAVDRCPALGIPLIYERGVQGTTGDNSPSVDQRLPGEGYTPGNTQVLSQLANRIKTNATPEQLRLVADFCAVELHSSA